MFIIDSITAKIYTVRDTYDHKDYGVKIIIDKDGGYLEPFFCNCNNKLAPKLSDCVTNCKHIDLVRKILIK